MEIEKILKPQADNYLTTVYTSDTKLVEIEIKIKNLLEDKELFIEYESLRANYELETLEAAYYEGAKAGLKIYNSILELGKINLSQLKEV